MKETKKAITMVIAAILVLLVVVVAFTVVQKWFLRTTSQQSADALDVIGSDEKNVELLTLNFCDGGSYSLLVKSSLDHKINVSEIKVNQTLCVFLGNNVISPNNTTSLELNCEGVSLNSFVNVMMVTNVGIIEKNMHVGEVTGS